MILKSFLFSILAAFLFYLARTFLHTDMYLSDLGGLGAFLTVFGTLYGITTAFIVFEVWGQYNKTQELVHKEAQGIEGLFKLTVYFRDKALLSKMRKTIENYLGAVSQGKFEKLGKGMRNPETGKLFRDISKVINGINFDDNHDAVIFDQIVSHYRYLAGVRTERINQSLTRLPSSLKSFLYVSSAVALLTFIVMPFSNMYFGFLASGSLGYVLAMLLQLVEDLDNPFVGNWNITPEPFERTLTHIRATVKE